MGVADCCHLASHYRTTRPEPFHRCGSNAPARVYTVSGPTIGPFLLDVVAVKLVVVVPIDVDVLVLKVAMVLLDVVVAVLSAK